MKMKNIAEMFIFIPHTLESVLCPYGEVFCTMPFDMISWIITHMNIAAKPFLEASTIYYRYDVGFNTNSGPISLGASIYTTGNGCNVCQ